MIQIVKDGNVASILFTDSDFYLFNSGQIIVPLNSLSMVVDKSDMATFRKSSNNDLLFSAKISKITMGGTQLTKANAKTLFDSILAGPTGGGGFRFVSVETLPETGEDGIIYLVPEGDDSFEEYVWLDDENRFEKLGFETDLTGYVNSGNFETYLTDSQAFSMLEQGVSAISASVSANTANISTLSGAVSANTASIANKQNARLEAVITLSGQAYTINQTFATLYAKYLSGADIIAQMGNSDNVYQLSQISNSSMTFSNSDAHEGVIENFHLTSGDVLTREVYDIPTKLQGKQNVLTAGNGISIENDTISVTGGTPTSGYVTTEELEESELVTSAALNDLNTRVIEVSASTSAVTSLSGDVQTLSATVSGNSSDIVTLSGNVNTLSGDVSANTSNIATISGNVSTISATVTGNTSDISTLSGNVTSISGQIGDIATALSNIVGE